MVTLTLIQGVVNTFVFFLSRVIGNIVDKVLLRNERGPGIGYMVTVIISQIVLGILANIIVAWFSRQREFRADRGGASVAGTGNMVAALERLIWRPTTLPAQLAGRHQGRRRAGLSGVHEPPTARRASEEQNER